MAEVMKLPPQNIEAEKSVLGAIMIDPEAIVKVADILEEDDFYKKNHKTIFTAMKEIYSKGEPIDILSLSSRLKEKKHLKPVGGVSYLTELVNQVPTISNVSHYAQIVKKKKILRDLISASQKIIELGYDESQEIEFILDKAEKAIFNISKESLKQDFIRVKEAIEEAWERIEKLHREGKSPVRGIPTGFTDLDNILSGLQKSDLIILASRPSIGKTTLALDITRYAAVKEKIPVGIFSLEMSKDQLVDRLLAAEAGISLWKMRTGKLSTQGKENDFVKLQNAFGILSNAPIFIDDAGSSTVMQIKTLSRRLQLEKGLGLIIIDYLQLMQSQTSTDNRVQEVSQISRSLKSLAKELNVPILALSQLSRAVEHRPDRIPRLADLRESGSIEQDADVVMFIHREDKINPNTERKNIADIIIAKHRNGPTGRTELFFNPSQVKFENLDKAHKEEVFDEDYSEITEEEF